MEESFTIIKIRTLEKQRANLIEEYQAVTDQIDAVLDPSSRTRLKRQAQKIEKEIHDLEAELKSLAVALVHDDKPANPTAVVQQADELVEPESVAAEENDSQPKPFPEPADDSPKPEPKKDDDQPDELAEPEPAPPQENTPDLTALSQPSGIFEVATGFVKQWLWAQFLLWTLVSALSFTSDLGGVLDLTLLTRLLVLGLLVFVGGVVILGISLLPAFRAHYHVWDRRLTAALWLIISAAILGFWQTEIGKPKSEVVVTTPTPTATGTFTPTATMTPAVTPSVTATIPSTPTLIPSIVPAEPGTLTYFDDFESNTNNWRTWSDGDGRAWYENGGYNVRSYANTRGWMSIKLDDPHTNMILEVDVVPITHELVTGYAIAIGWTEGENYYMFEVQAGGACGFNKIVERRLTGSLTYNTLCPSPVQNESVRVRLEISQGKVIAFINEKYAGQKVWLDRDPYKGGNIGLGVYNSGEVGSGAQAQVMFDNLAIWQFKAPGPDYPYDD